MTTTSETYPLTYTTSKDSSETTSSKSTTTTTTTNNDDPSLLVANVTIDELVESCCNEVVSSSSSSQLNNSSSVSPTHLVRFVHSQASLVSQIDESNPIQQSPMNSILSSHDSPIKQPPLINVTRLPSPFSTLKPKTRIESNNAMHNTTNLTNITANNISVNNYNVNIHTTNVQPPTPTTLLNNPDHLNKPCPLDEKQTTEIVSQILKNIKEVENHHEPPASSTTTNYNIHIDSFNFSSSTSSTDQTSTNLKKTRVKKEAKALTRIIVKDEPTHQLSPNFLSISPNNNNGGIATVMTSGLTEFIAVPYGWQRRILASDLVVYLSPTNAILDSFDAIRRYLESPTSCKCGLQCPLIVDKVFNFDSNVKSKSWEVTQVLEGTHCRQKSNILEMATLTNCIDSFCKTEQKPVKRRKRVHQESNNGNVFVCASNNSTGTTTTTTNPNESVVFLNNPTAIAAATTTATTTTTTTASTTNMTSDGSQSMSWTPTRPSPNITPPSKRPRGRPRKTAITPPTIAQLSVKPSTDPSQTHPPQPVPLSILSPPASVSSNSQNTLVHRNSTSPSTTNLRYLHDHAVTPPILPSTTDTHVIARVPSIFDQVKSTTNESSFAVLSGVQNVLLSPNRENTENKQTIRTDPNKQVTLNVNALKPDFVRSPAAAQKPCVTSTNTNQIDVISLMGASTPTQLILSKVPAKTTPSATVPQSNSTTTTTTTTTSTMMNNNNEDFNSSTTIVTQTAAASDSSTNEPTSQPLMIDFNDPSTTNFLLSALASGASSDSNAIVNHLFQKAQTQQQQQRAANHPAASLPSTSPPGSMKRKLPLISTGLKNCTETTNLLPVTTANTTVRPTAVVVQTPSTTNEGMPTQQLVLTSNDERKQQIFFINNKPYVIQQKITHDQTSQQRLILTPSIAQTNEVSQTIRPSLPMSTNNSNSLGQSTLDDGGNCLLLNGAVEPKTLRSLLKGLNPSSVSGVDHIIDTIHRFEHNSSTTTPGEHTNTIFMKSAGRTNKASPAKKSTTDKPPVRRRASKKLKQDESQQQQTITTTTTMTTTTVATPSLTGSVISLPINAQSAQTTSNVPQPILIEQQHQWQTDFNSFDFSSSWGSDTNLNSLLLNDDFDNAASFDDVNFGDFEPYMNASNHPNNTDPILPSLFVKPFPPDSLPSVDHLLP